ncbi:MAG: hypothetical protein E7075_05920 [Bacteroidales bacterium]|nr:hypothetical protein [Bacteroidales bacterium]
MRQYVQEIAQVLHLMSEQELKDSIEKFCQYLLFKYGEYYIDDFDDDTTKPVFDTVRTGEYTIRLSGRTITCQNIHSNHGTLSLVSISLPFREGAGVGSSLPLTALKGKPNHIAVAKALIEMVNGLHQAEERMFGPEAAEWY